MGLCACLKGATKRIDALLRLMQPSTTTQNEAKGGADLPGSSFLVDLFFKAPLAQFFDAGNLEGVRFMWHERRSSADHTPHNCYYVVCVSVVINDYLRNNKSRTCVLCIFNRALI